MNPMLSHPLYRKALAGEAVATATRTVFCVNLGRVITRVGQCGANDERVCDRFGVVVTHNGRCQGCPEYVADR